MKLLLVLFLALVVNIGMFVLMDSMVSTGAVRTVDIVDVQPIEFVRTPVDEETRTRDRRTPPPPAPREIVRPQAQVTDIAQRASNLEALSPAFEIASLLGEGGGVDIGQNLLGAAAGDFDVMMANDLVPVSMLPPQYPSSARMRNVEGWVDVIFIVSERGNVEQAWVVESEPPDIFDQAALDAALRWRFRPVTENGEPVSAERIIRINFTMDRGSR